MTRRSWAILGLIGLLGVVTVEWLVFVLPLCSRGTPDAYAIYAASIRGVQRTDGRALTVHADRSDGVRFSDAWIAAAPFAVQPTGDLQLSPITLRDDQTTARVRIGRLACGVYTTWWTDLTLRQRGAAWTIVTTQDGGEGWC